MSFIVKKIETIIFLHVSFVILNLHMYKFKKKIRYYLQKPSWDGVNNGMALCMALAQLHVPQRGPQSLTHCVWQGKVPFALAILKFNV